MSAVPNRRPTVIFGSRAGLLDVLSTDLWWHRAGFLWLLTSFDSFDHLYSGRNLSDWWEPDRRMARHALDVASSRSRRARWLSRSRRGKFRSMCRVMIPVGWKELPWRCSTSILLRVR